ncbi:AGAP013171-PA-like protein [Anopheles sinensis]|uniref:AGAP013171-PA-like protein n=1 Tax=Anopheles sinensis TaxID=74873 RepID=A0A084VSG4_ANOSI|nr:AGAP013171-PA-like protein [Anopheles sinensis]
MGDFLYSSSVLANESCVTNPSLLDTLSINNLLNIKHLTTGGADIGAGSGVSDSLGTIGESSSSSSSVSGLGERSKNNNASTISKMASGGGGGLSLGPNGTDVDGQGLLMTSSVAASSCGVGGLSSVSSIITTAMSSEGCSLSLALGSGGGGGADHDGTVTSSLLNGGSITSPSIGVNLGNANGNNNSTGHSHSNNGSSSSNGSNANGNGNGAGGAGGNPNNANNNLLLDSAADQLQLQSVAEELSLKASDLGCLSVTSNLMNGSSHIGSCLAPSGLGFGATPDHSSPWSTGPDEAGQGGTAGGHLSMNGLGGTSSAQFPNKAGSLSLSSGGGSGSSGGGGGGGMGGMGGMGGGFPGPLDMDENRDPFLSSYQVSDYT